MFAENEGVEPDIFKTFCSSESDIFVFFEHFFDEIFESGIGLFPNFLFKLERLFLDIGDGVTKIAGLEGGFSR
jgi:hypothetical protein